MQHKVRWGLAAAFGLLVMSLGTNTVSAAPKVYKIGDRVADFSLKDEHGKMVKLSQFKGKTVILNFYASW